MVPDRNPVNFFNETEQVAFHPGMWCRASISPTIRFSRGTYSRTRTPRSAASVVANFQELPMADYPMSPTA
ncbi:MAG: catalase [Hyphomicrobiales bacterium]|nr:catalase [Hyphomicrobiales bacterium]MBV9907533.1 catalase [Hyphomicrobiales bacterium]